jgi:hypothetical protein
MGIELRKKVRRRMGLHAFLRTRPNAPLEGCIVRDISEGGARLAVLGAAALPDEFDLVMFANSSVSRRCRVAWRADKEVGVEFVRGGREGAQR